MKRNSSEFGNMAAAGLFLAIILAGGLQYIGKLADILLAIADSMGGVLGQVVGSLLVSLAGML